MPPTVSLPRLVRFVLAATVIVGLTVINRNLYVQRRTDSAIAQLRFLSDSLDRGGAENMQALFPEGQVFTWALYGLASAELARSLPPSDPFRAEALRAARTAVDHVVSDAALLPFVREMEPAHGAFYASWSLYLRSVVLRARGSGDPAPFDLAGYEADCDSLAAALTAGESPFLESYPGAVWPADTAVGVAALAIRNQVLDPRHQAIIDWWVEAAHERMDPGFGALTHEASAIDGLPVGGPRGGSLALMSRLLVDVDSALARQQYGVLRQYFVDYAWGIPGVREYPHGVNGPADIDSGPIVFGFGGPATVVGLGAALAHGDEKLATSLLATADMTGFPIEIGGKRRYAGGLLPVGDAFLAWARTTPPGTPHAPFKSIIPAWWRWPVHALSMMTATGMLFVAVSGPQTRHRRSSRRRAGASAA